MRMRNFKVTILLALLVLLSWLIYSGGRAWSAFPGTVELNNLSYSELEAKFGKPAVVMEGKFIAWDHLCGIFKSSVLISHERKMLGLTRNLLIEKTLSVEFFSISIRVVRKR